MHTISLLINLIIFWGLPLMVALVSPSYSGTHGQKFVIHRVVRPPMQAEYHLIDLHPVTGSNDTHGVRVVCFQVILLARLIHRIWWYYMSDKTSGTSGLVTLQIVTSKFPTIPTELSIASILNGLGYPVDLADTTDDDDGEELFCDDNEADDNKAMGSDPKFTQNYSDDDQAHSTSVDDNLPVSPPDGLAHTSSIEEESVSDHAQSKGAIDSSIASLLLASVQSTPDDPDKGCDTRQEDDLSIATLLLASVQSAPDGPDHGCDSSQADAHILEKKLLNDQVHPTPEDNVPPHPLIHQYAKKCRPPKQEAKINSCRNHQHVSHLFYD
jgi:hypothetical protein